MDVNLTAAETILWNTDPSWQKGFLLGAQKCAPLDVLWLRILDDGGTLLAKSGRNVYDWTTTP